MSSDADIYILDSKYRRNQVISDYISLVWHEKFYEYGEFELECPSTPIAVNNIQTGAFLGSDFSDRVMKIKAVYETEDSDGKRILKATGHSFEKVLDGRIAWRDLSALKTESNDWVVSKTAFKHVDDNIRKAILNGTGSLAPFYSQDVIPDLRGDINLYPADTNVVPSTSITVSQGNPTDVYTYITDICKLYGVGFRIYRNTSSLDGGLIYNAYSGRNLTRQQTVNTPVLFSVNLDNVESLNFYESHEDYVSGVLVYSTNGVTPVFRDGESNSTHTGESRVMKTMNVTEPDGMTSAERAAYRKQLGLESLIKTNPVFVLEGEIAQTSQYKYHRDYELGDIVELGGNNNYVSRMRVVEQIFTINSEGFKSYPGLTVEDTIAQGYWSKFGSTEWVNASGTWSTQPTN